MERTVSCDPSLALLSLMAEYHDLANHGLPSGRDRPARTRLIEELLARRPKKAGARRIPVQMQLHRPALVTTEGGEVIGATLGLSIDSVELALAKEGRTLVERRGSVVVAIQTGLPKVWWRFAGEVARVGARARTVKIRLLQSLGCAAVPASAAAVGRASVDDRRPPPAGRADRPRGLETV